MISFFPDLNVWLALTARGHRHNEDAWGWLRTLPSAAKLVFARYTQVGLLRLLTNESVMGEQTLTLNQAWTVYDRWLQDPRVEFHPEPPDIESGFRKASAPFGAKPASKWVGDCYLLAFAQASQSSLVTFDKALFALARKQGNHAVMPG
jgi:toxin-antitoxin system PIN domain toxin